MPFCVSAKISQPPHYMSARDIRFLQPADADALWALRLEALGCEDAAFGSSAAEHRSLSIDEFRGRISADPANSFVVGAFKNGRLVGMAGFAREVRLKERHKGRIWGVYLAAGCRGSGIGRQMLNALIERARHIDGLEQIMLRVVVQQTAAVALYRSLGFTSFGCEPRALKIGTQYFDEDYMMLRL